MAGKAKRAARTAAYKRKIMIRAADRLLRPGVEQSNAYYWQHASTAAPLRVSALEPLYHPSLNGTKVTLEQLVVSELFKNWTTI